MFFCSFGGRKRGGNNIIKSCLSLAIVWVWEKELLNENALLPSIKRSGLLLKHNSSSSPYCPVVHGDVCVASKKRELIIFNIYSFRGSVHQWLSSFDMSVGYRAGGDFLNPCTNPNSFTDKQNPHALFWKWWSILSMPHQIIQMLPLHVPIYYLSGFTST